MQSEVMDTCFQSACRAQEASAPERMPGGALVPLSASAVVAGPVPGAWVEERQLGAVAALGFIVIGGWIPVRG